MITSRGDISRKLQLFHNRSALRDDNFYRLNIIGDIPQLYARDCMENVFNLFKDMNLDEYVINAKPLLSPI